MIYLHKNGITVVAKEEAKRGKVYELNGEEYYIAKINDFNSLSGLKNLKKLSIDKIVLHNPKSIFIN